jgi:hypothetical protein
VKNISAKWNEVRNRLFWRYGRHFDFFTILLLEKRYGMRGANTRKTVVCSLYLRNRKHSQYFFKVIDPRVEIWDNEKCCGKTSPTLKGNYVFPHFKFFQTFTSVSITLQKMFQTWSKCFLFPL